MRIITFTAAAFLVTGAAGAAEPTRLDAAQLDWITASTAAAPIAQEVARSDGAKLEGFDIVDAARSDIEAALGADLTASGGGKQPASAAPTVAAKSDAGGIKPIVGGGTMAVASGTGAGSVDAFASQTITSTGDGKGTPIVTLSTGGLSTGSFSGFASAPAPVPTATPTTMPTAMPTTASLGSASSLSLLGGFSAMPSFSLGSGG